MEQKINMRAAEAAALYSDETEMFLSPMEPAPGDFVTIRFRAAADSLQEAALVFAEAGELPMEKEKQQAGFAYYRAEIRVGSSPYAYYFRLRTSESVYYFGRDGISEEPEEAEPFRIIPGFRTPDWAKGAVMYQIFPDRFRKGSASNDVRTGEYSYLGKPVRREEDWNALPEPMDVGNFHGGDLQGILEKLDYLQDLGIQAIYLNPVFVSPSNHKYDTQDYDHIDPHLGRIVNDVSTVLPEGETDNSKSAGYIRRTTDPVNLAESDVLFAKLTDEAHKRGIRVILDGVFNHCGSFHKWLDREGIYAGKPGYARGAYADAESPYRSYFDFKEDAWPDNDSYEGWWNEKTLPKLNYEGSPALQNEILRIAKKWISPPYNADGWRLDVAADLAHSPEWNHQFWKKFRKTVKETNPDALILAEHYGDPSSWLAGDEWDTVMNYDAFMDPVSYYLTGMEKHSDVFRKELLCSGEEFERAMRTAMGHLPCGSLLAAMNQLDNHDHSRFLTRTNRTAGRLKTHGAEAAGKVINKAVLREAVVMQMTWPGAPALYYGDEAGLCGFTDPDSRRAYPWGKEDAELLSFYRKAIRMHRNSPALCTGSFLLLLADARILAYGRFSEEEQIAVILNNREAFCRAEIPVWRLGTDRSLAEDEWTVIFSTDREGFSEEQSTYQAGYGVLALDMQPQSAVVLRHRS